MEDIKNIVGKAKSGDVDAIGKLYQFFQKKGIGLAYQYVKSESLAEDMYQDAFIKAMEHLDTFDESKDFNPWLNTIIVNTCKNYQNKKKTTNFGDMSDEELEFVDTLENNDESVMPEQAIDHKEITQIMDEILASLPDVQRQAVLLYYYNEMSVKEIADIQGVSEDTVKSRLNYSRKKVGIAVEEVQKKKGIHLYSMSAIPLFFYVYFKCGMSAYAAEITAGAGIAGTSAAVKSSIIAGGNKSFFNTFKGFIKRYFTKKVVIGVAVGAVGTGVALVATIDDVKIYNLEYEFSENDFTFDGEIIDMDLINKISNKENLSVKNDDGDFDTKVIEIDGYPYEIHLSGRDDSSIHIAPVYASGMSIQKMERDGGSDIEVNKSFLSHNEVSEKVDGYQKIVNAYYDSLFNCPIDLGMRRGEVYEILKRDEMLYCMEQSKHPRRIENNQVNYYNDTFYEDIRIKTPLGYIVSYRESDYEDRIIFVKDLEARVLLVKYGKYRQDKDVVTDVTYHSWRFNSEEELYDRFNSAQYTLSTKNIKKTQNTSEPKNSVPQQETVEYELQLGFSPSNFKFDGIIIDTDIVDKVTVKERLISTDENGSKSKNKKIDGGNISIYLTKSDDYDTIKIKSNASLEVAQKFTDPTRNEVWMKSDIMPDPSDDDFHPERNGKVCNALFDMPVEIGMTRSEIDEIFKISNILSQFETSECVTKDDKGFLDFSKQKNGEKILIKTEMGVLQFISQSEYRIGMEFDDGEMIYLIGIDFSRKNKDEVEEIRYDVKRKEK